jgi:hypothetical protein
MSDLKINNNSVSSRFEVLVDGKSAFLDYRIDGDTIMLSYVEVPIEEQGSQKGQRPRTSRTRQPSRPAKAAYTTRAEGLAR